MDILDVIAPFTHYTHIHRTDRALSSPMPDGAVVVFAAGGNEQYIPALNALIAPMPWVVLLLTSDECSNFPWHRIHHPNMRLWVQSARSDKHKGDITYFPVGCPDTKEMLATISTKDIDIGFSGQITHLSREQMAWAFEASINATIKPSPGFTQGLERKDYLDFMSRTKVAPCPSGPCHADTFRLYEALEAGCVPILDHGPRPDEQGRAIAGFPRDFWTRLFGVDHPAPVVEGWSQGPRYAESVLSTYPERNNEVSAWWQLKKREFRLKLQDDIYAVSGQFVGPIGSNITCVIPSSPTPNNPDFSHLEATVAAIRNQLPTSEILLMLDGLYPAQSHLASNYHEYVRRVLWACNHHWFNVVPFLYTDYLHQSGKLIRTLPHIRTDYILWNEHDTPLEGDIDWEACITELAEDRLDLIRFYHEPNVHPEHEWLMRGRHSDLFLRTVQQSGRPHLATTAYYRRVMADHFSDDSCTFIEYVMHSVCQQEDIQPWEQHRMALYAPVDAEVIKRSGHIDARGGESTFEETLRV